MRVTIHHIGVPMSSLHQYRPANSQPCPICGTPYSWFLPLSIPSGDSTQFLRVHTNPKVISSCASAPSWPNRHQQDSFGFPNFAFSITLDTSQHRGKQSISLCNIRPLPYHFLSQCLHDTKLCDPPFPITP